LETLMKARNTKEVNNLVSTFLKVSRDSLITPETRKS
jgi:hypothetical protein